jgi:hypothetical protein
MYNNYDYPAGADTPDAPWNKKEPEERDFHVNVVVKLSKDETITTNNYIPVMDDEDGSTYADTENTDWVAEYKEKKYTIEDLLIELQQYIIKDLAAYKGNKRKEAELNDILSATQGWVTDEIEIEEL